MSADDWDAVFAMAEGGGSSGDATAAAVSYNEVAPKRGIEREATSTREDKNRRRTKKRKSSTAAAAVATTQKQYLLDRCNSEANTNGIHDSTSSGAAAGTAASLSHSFGQRAPSGKQPKSTSHNGKSRNSTGEQWYCAEWKKARSDDNNSTSGSSTTSLQKQLCNCCRLPPGGHVLVSNLDTPSSSNRNTTARVNNCTTAITNMEDTYDVLLCNIYTSIRNLRCWCRWQLVVRDQRGHCDDGTYASNMLGQATESTSRRIGICMESTQFWTDLSGSLESIRQRSRDELWLEPISTKGLELLNHQAKLTAATIAAPHKSTLSWACFEGLVQCIMACDAVYYQLYYAQLTLDAADCAQSAFWIPHPISYFGEWEQNVNDAAGGITTEQIGRDNALVMLHRLRQAETTAIFANWMTRYPHVPASFDTWHVVAKGQQDDDAYSAFTAQHATLAPPLLVAWRDSCRDFVCHLYSYATLSNDTLRSVLAAISTKNGHDIRYILEVGAGTGCLAHLLTKIATDTVAASSRTTPGGLDSSSIHAATYIRILLRTRLVILSLALSKSS